MRHGWHSVLAIIIKTLHANQSQTDQNSFVRQANKMGTVVQLFPKKKIAYRIPLYGEFEVKLTVAIINLFGSEVKRAQLACIPPFATTKNLKLYSPTFVIDCLRRAHDSEIFSAKGRATILKILANIEEVDLHKEA